MKFRSLLCISLLILTMMGQAQTAERTLVASAGGSFSNASFSADYSVGEVVVMTLTSPGVILTQGFQQPPPSDVSVIEPNPNSGISIYPNPGAGQYQLVLRDNVTDPVTIRIYDVLGKVLYSKVIDLSGNVPLELNLGHLATGTYYMRVSSDQYSSDIRFVNVSK